MTTLRRFFCGLTGHAYLTHHGDGRIVDRCVCGHERAGWTLDCPAPRVRYHGLQWRHRMPRRWRKGRVA